MHTNQIIRLIKILLSSFLSIYAFLIFYGNVSDFDSNFEFVKHVLSMDSIFEGSVLSSRAITSNTIHLIAYYSIICAEFTLFCLAFTGTIFLFKKRNHDKDSFHEAKKFTLLALALGLSIFYLGFQVIGSEWFAMWQSENGMAFNKLLEIAVSF